MNELVITVYGSPAPKGSKDPKRNKYNGRIYMVENSARLDPWRNDIRQAVFDTLHGNALRLEGPIACSITFCYDRPKGHWRTGRNAHLIRAGAPRYPIAKKNDIDKLERAVLDAIGSTGVVWRDDGQVVHLEARKVYTYPQEALDRPGALIRIWPYTPDFPQPSVPERVWVDGHGDIDNVRTVKVGEWL